MYDRQIPLGDFSPDLPPTTPGVITDMSGLEVTKKGLRTMADHVEQPIPALGGHPIGCYAAVLQNGSYQVFAAALFGIGAIIYRLKPPSYDEWEPFIDLNTSATRMRYATFGNYVLAVNGKGPPRIYRDGTDATFVHLSDVSDLPADYIASTVCTTDYGIFLVAAGSDEWWFSLSPLLWGAPGFPGIPSVASGTVRSGIPGIIGSSGPITGAVQCRGGLVFYKESSMHLGQYSGPPFLWNFQTISKTVGCPWQEAIIDTGDVHLFPGPDDFWMFDGSSLTPIPNNLREWFYRRIQPLQSEYVQNNPYPNIIGRWDSTTGTAYWHYSVPADPDGTLSEYISFNTRENKWGRGQHTMTDLILPFFPYRDAAQHVVQRIPGHFDETFKLHLQNGGPSPWFFLTGEYGDGAKMYQLNRLRPTFADYPSDRNAHVQAYKRNLFGYQYPDLGQLPKDVVGPEAWLTDDGAFNLIQTSRSHQFRIEGSGQMEITALQADFVPAGEE